MNYRYFIYQFIIFFFLCSCSNLQHEKSVSRLKVNHNTIDLGENFIGYGGFLAFYQGVIIGLDFGPTMKPFFYLNTNESSQTFFHFGNKGQGPNDFLSPFSIQHINHHTVGTFDLMSNTYYEFSIPNENEGVKIDKKIRFQARLTRIIKTAYNQYIGLSIDERMFLLADSTGIPVNTFFEYPYHNNDERQFVTRSNAYQGTLSANPSKNKFVYSSFQGEIIHFYEIENNNIKTIAKIENEYPLYKKTNDGHAGIAFGSKGICGYIATYATDKFVYAIFSGKTILESTKSANFEGNVLRVFDWEGTLQKEYELDVPSSYLCVSDDDSKIWAIVSNPDITIVLFDLENATEKKQVDEMKEKQNLIDSTLSNGPGCSKEDSLKVFPDSVVQIMDGTIHVNTSDKHSVNVKQDTNANNTITYRINIEGKNK